VTRPRTAKICSRCQGSWRFGFNWPEGYVCRSCVTRATKVRGICPGCGTGRLLVGRDGDGRAACVDCSGITTSFRCATCGAEGQTWFSKTCVTCSLRRRLTETLDDGTGQPVPALQPLADYLLTTPSPIAAMHWARKPKVTQRLTALARGEVPLTHEGIDTMPPGQSREHLRELLQVTGILPMRDKYLAAFEAWTQRRLTTIDDPAARGEVERYLSWRQARALRIRAAAGPVLAQAVNAARDQTDAAIRFLAFLSNRQGHPLAELTQADVDDWFSSVSNSQAARDFLVFAIERRCCPRVKIPDRGRRSSPGCAPERLATITHRLLTDESADLGDRVAGLLVVLLAQPVTRIASLETHNVVEDGDGLALRIGIDPFPVPDALAVLLRRLVDAQPRTDSPHLFPGGRPGQHLTAAMLTARLNRLGITRNERQGALSRLVAEVPSAIVARATGYSLEASARRSAQGGIEWTTYAALKAADHR
jgi:hypothetical protein